MQHYFNPMSRAASTDWTLKELDVDHEQVFIDIQAGDAEKPEFRAINPMGKIPVLVDDGLVVTETAAIYAYLADKFIDRGLAPALSSPERGKYYRYMFFSGTTLETAFAVEQMGIKDYPAQSMGWGDLERCLNTLEVIVPKDGWVLGEQFSAADVVFGGILDFAIQFGWLAPPSQLVADYVGRIRERPAYRASHGL
ncbi:MAG: glutathione S-transferase family protein [Pseudomonadales bacterium]|nr:glutathione S-transferase family protein [Pseudomonadales bacterium]